MDLPTTQIRVIRCESGEPVGDILLELADGALLFIEVKRSICSHRKRMTNTAFDSAVQLTQTLYSTAVIHCVAEKRESEWCNLYTSLTYGREIDLLSVPDYVEHDKYGAKLLCLPWRVQRSAAELLVSEASKGSATFDSWTMEYAIPLVLARS
jgi:hypothetical protein